VSQVDARTHFGSLTADDVARLDRAAIDSGVSVTQLMEVAGFQVARLAWQLLGGLPGRVTAVAGKGNNGGDALVAARMLEAWGCDVRTAPAEGEDIESIARDSALLIDGILGTGLRTPPREPQASVIRAMNARGIPTLAIDVPSGMDASSGEIFDPCIRAVATCTLAAMKAGLWTSAARSVAGDVWAADIGMPRAAWHAAGLEPPAGLRGGALLSVASATLY